MLKITEHQVFTTAKISTNMELTPEGFLLCKDVPIARIGIMYYAEGEVDELEAGPTGIIIVNRSESDLFTEMTITSATGKPVTNDHPDKHVNPSTYNDLSIGTAINIRRGEGVDSDLLLADLLITSEQGIKEIDLGKREISLGYIAKYEELSQGEYRQFDIVINHIALVERGRCGSRCSVKDSNQEVIKMINRKTSQSKKRTSDSFAARVIGYITQAHMAKDTAALSQVINDAVEDPDLSNGCNDSGEEGSSLFNDDDMKAYVEQNAKEHEEFRAAISALQEAISKLSPGTSDAGEKDPEENKTGGTSEKDPEENKTGGTSEEDEVKDEDMEKEAPGSTKDSSGAIQKLLMQITADAEIVAPGISVPTFDTASSPKKLYKGICDLRRSSLEAAMGNNKTKDVVASLLGNTDGIKSMTCDATRVAFNAAAKIISMKNNETNSSIVETVTTKVSALSIGDIQKGNEEFYGRN